jgi:YD repeat-containing protein
MTYDGENRPVSVSFAGKTTTYVYGADGARLKKVESDPLAGTSVTLYLGAAHPNIRVTRTKSGSTVTTKVSALHADGLGSGSGR